ncbi:MAG TPA: DUF2334 domain-containing protein [Pirellulales bacterium]|nr:DUF2334 domain-containing protein [Pirellulales bacterium]
MTSVLADLPLLLADVPPSLRCALEREGVPFAEAHSGRAGRFVLFDSRRRAPALDRDQVAIDVDHLRRGRTHDPFQALADERAACFEWHVGRLAVRETVARVDQAAVRKRLLSDLRTLVESAGGVWMRLSAYPHPYRTAFNFRLDHDQYDAHDFQATLSAIEGHEHAISHYVCAATHARHGDALARLRGAHVGSHGWWHHTYREQSDNATNIRRGIDCLRACGLNPTGFAAPHGRFHRNLLAALEELAVTHSSEFGLAYDDLPFFPSQSNVLQIPIHPICLGICLDAARRIPCRPISDAEAAESTLEHWQTVASEKHRAGEPIFFYGHPDGRVGQFPHVLRELLETVSQLPGTWCTTLAAFEDWWRARSGVRLEVVRRDDQVQVTARGLPSGYRCALECHRGQEMAIVELENQRMSFSDAALSWQRQRPLRPIRAAGLRHPMGVRAGIKWYLDWEKVTPIDQIDAQSWRGWAKRTLRRMRA